MNEQLCDFSILRDLRKRHALSILELAAKSGVSFSVISKLERNQTTASLETLYRIAKTFGMTLTDLVGLAEKRTTHRVDAEKYHSGDFNFERISYDNTRCMHAHVLPGSKVTRPEIHRDDYELCWVLSGKMQICLPGETAVLGKGQAIQFDALLPHSYQALEESDILIVHNRKGKRF